MKDYKLKSGNILRVIQDENAESPDIWKNEDIFLVYDHRDFTVKREGFDPKDIYDHLFDEIFENEIYNDYYIFSVDAYIHSGVHLSLAGTKDYSDREWDVSTTGYVLVKKEICKNVELDITIKDKYFNDEDKGRYFAENLIETWNQYLSGNVYGSKLLKPIKVYTITEEDLNKIGLNRSIDREEFINCCDIKIEYEELDSCWGFYGSDPKTNGMLDYINDEIID